MDTMIAANRIENIQEQLIETQCHLKEWKEKCQDLSRQLNETKCQAENWKQKYEESLQFRDRLLEAQSKALEVIHENKHYKTKLRRYEMMQDQQNEKIERLSEEVMELKKELIRTSNDKTSSSIKHAKTEQVLMHLLEKQRGDIRKLTLKNEQQENHIQELENRLRNQQVKYLEARSCINHGEQLQALQASEREVRRFQDNLQNISPELSRTSRCDARERPEIRLTHQEQRLSSVTFGGSIPSLPVLNEFGCKYSCVILSLSLHCRRNGVSLCPLCLVKVATLIVAKSDGCQDLNDEVYECELALKLLERSKFVKKMKSKPGINDIEALNEALRYVTGAEDSPSSGGGLLVLEYRNRRVGHCVTYWKDRGKIRIFDPQKGDWWRETDYGRIVAVHSYQVDGDLVKSAEKASCLLSRLPPL